MRILYERNSFRSLSFLLFFEDLLRDYRNLTKKLKSKLMSNLRFIHLPAEHFFRLLDFGVLVKGSA